MCPRTSEEKRPVTFSLKGVKRIMKYGCRIAVFALICFFGVSNITNAQEEEEVAQEQAPQQQFLQFSGFGSLEYGQYVNYYMLKNPRLPRQSLLRSFLHLEAARQLTAGLQIHAGIEAKLFYNTFGKRYYTGLEAFELPDKYFSFYIHRVDATYSLGDTASPYLQFTLGYFPFKYNPDTRDLGEYLYRSGTYPAVLINEFDFPMSRLAGLKVSSNLFGSLHRDLLLTLETDFPPYFDLNAGYIFTYDAAKIVQIGLGGMYRSLIPADNSLTTPRDPGNFYLKNPYQTYSVDTATGLTDTNYAGDTIFYTVSGLKLMARLSFDPKRIFTGADDDFGIFGKEDLKLYGEIAILGVANYPADTAIKKRSSNFVYGYDTLLHKMPIMLGFDVPTFKLLDVFAAEVEWYGCTYPNSYYVPAKDLIPQPETPDKYSPGLDIHNYHDLDNWKWAFYAKKSFKNGLYVVGQIACDHVRNETPIPKNVDREEALRSDRSWMWVLKAGCKF
jgi:hypothetical protein